MALQLLGSDVVRKWPRCSLQKAKVYSDCRVDPTQLTALRSVWSAILLCGALPAAGAAYYATLMCAPRAARHARAG